MGTRQHLGVYERPQRNLPDGVVAQATQEILITGREAFEINCVPCHGLVGYGDGPVVQRGFPKPESFHTEKMRALSDGRIFAAISEGKGSMYSFADRLSEKQRRLIVKYVRSLQLSQNFSYDQLSDAEKREVAK